MKIGVLTLCGENYGCALQTLAVLKTYEAMGHQALLIPDKTSKGIKVTHNKQSKLSKLTPSYICAVIRVRTKNKYYLKNQRDSLLDEILHRNKNHAKYKVLKACRSSAFKDFYQNYIKQTDFSISLGNLPKDKLSDFDFFSVGSDQVWNPTYPETSEIKFLTFVPKSKKLTFAPSFGISQLPSFTKEPYAEWLSEFPCISVREERGAEIIKELTGKDATVICDPTMTITKEVWESIEKKPLFDTDTPYALTYFLGNETNKYRKYIEKTAKKKGLRIINLFDIREPEFYSADPAEFLYLIHHADAVFTDSFHAAVFSIIYKRDFVVFDRVEDGRSMGSRLKTLLSKFSLTHRMFSAMSDKSFTSVDFSKTDSILEKERNNAISFLKASIEANLK